MEKESKKLKYRKEIDKLTYEMRVFRSVMSSTDRTLQKEVYALYAIESSDFIERIDNIIIGIMNRDISARELAGSKEIEEDAPEHRSSSYPMNRCFKNEDSFILELMKFYTDYSSFFANRTILFGQILEMLRFIPYKGDSKEREYLLTCDYELWHYCYMIRKTNIDTDEYTRNLNEMLEKRATISTAANTKFLNFFLKNYRNLGAWISEETLKKMLGYRTYDDKRASRNVLSLICKEEFALPFTPQEYFDDLFKKLDEENTDGRFPLSTVAECFMSLINLFDVDACIEALVEKIVAHKYKKQLHHYMVEVVFLGNYKDSGLAEMFEEAFIEKERELQEKRKELVHVLRKVHDKKTK